MDHKLKIALDIGPLAVFFIAYKFAGVYAATVAIMLATFLSLGITYCLEKKISPMPLISGIVIAIFGMLTIIFHNEEFIKMKPTMVNIIFSSILLGGLYFKRPLLKYALGSALALSDKGWQVLSLRWGLFFLFLAGLNEFIWRNFPTDFWVNFKVFGMLTLTMVFSLLQLPLIKKYGRND